MLRAGLARRFLELTARLFDQLDEHLNEVWEPFLIDDDPPVSVALRS